MKKFSTIAAILMAGTMLFTACSSKPSEAPKTSKPENPAQTASKPLEKLTMASWSKPITEQTNVFKADSEGWFKEQGIEFASIPGAGGGDAIKNILTKQADVAFTDPGSLYFALEKGEKLRVIYNIYPQNVFNVVALKETGIREPKDLKGKKIGVYSNASGTRHNLLVLLNQAGLTENDVTIVETGVANFAPLMQKQVDATAATDTGLAAARAKGLGEVDVMEVKNASVNIPSDLFVVTEETFQQKKDLLKRFLAVYQKSADWMIKNPDEAATFAASLTAQSKIIDGQDVALNKEVIALRNGSSVSAETPVQGLGALDVTVLQKGADLYKQLGLIQTQLSLSDVVTTELLPKK